MFKARAIKGALLLLGLAACRAEPSNEAATGAPLESADATNAADPALPDADINASLGMLGADPQAPGTESGARRFAGRWAAQEGLCEHAAWTFTQTELRTPAGSVCRFTDVEEVAGGYDIAARCTAEGPERDDVLELRFAESADGLLFDSRSIAEAGLVRCAD